VPRFEAVGLRLIRADVRFADLTALEHVDAIVERSAEPSVLVGFDDVRSYAAQTNLVGAYNCATFARHNEAFLVFLSTSRVYPWS
jgi:CDP-paratose 2-epimerase